MSTAKFSHENLIVYQKTIAFIAWAQDLTGQGGISLTTRDQFERASNSVALNLAEGNGKKSPKDRSRFWQIAHGSALECAAVLDILVARSLRRLDQVEEGKSMLIEVVSMLVTLIDKLDHFDGRLREEPEGA